MCPRETGTRLIEAIGYSYPRLHEGKKWFIDFYCRDPATGGIRRKKYHVDSIRGKRIRRERAAELIEELWRKLRTGWNPWAGDDGNNIGRNYTLLSEATERYLEYIRRMDRRKTVLSYQSRVNVLREFIGTMPHPPKYVDQIDTAFACDFLDWIFLTRGVSTRTRNNYRGWLYTFCEYMVSRRYLRENPVKDIPSLRGAPTKKRELTDRMLHALFSYLRQTDLHYLLACYFEYFTFIRPTELSHIRIRDISVKEQTVFIDGSVSKNRCDGKVGLTRKIIELMLELGTFRHPSDHYLFGKDFKPAARRNGPDQFNKRWAKVRSHFGWGKEYLFYCLKNSGIRDLANSEGIVVARDQARHHDISTTNKYLNGRDRRVHESTKDFTGAAED